MKIPMRDPGERRKNDRVPANLEVEVVFQNGKMFTGILRDVSIDGIRVELKENDQLMGDEVRIKMFLPEGGKIHLQGKIVWKKHVNKGISFGVTKIEVLEEDREKFFEFLGDSFLNLFLSLVIDSNNGE